MPETAMPITEIGKRTPPKIEYVLDAEGENKKLSHAVRFRNRIRRRGTDYETIG